MKLGGKKAVVTGGVRGIGRAVVEKLVSREAMVSVFDGDSHGLEELRKDHRAVNCFVCDLSDYDDVARATSEYHQKFGAAHALINNAGIIYSSPLVRITSSGIERHDVAMWNKVLATDLSSVFYMTGCIVEKMILTRTTGVIVNVSSVSASGNAGQSAYSAAKAGVNALTSTWAKELSPLGIRVVAVAPGYSDTESTSAAVSEPVLREIVKRVPLRRLGRPDEIADAILYAIENDFFNGKVFQVDGGLIV